MSEKSNFLLNLSVLYRNTQKYFDKVLAPYDIGYGQLMLLLLINENEGMTMAEATAMSEVDKGTTTKSISRLIEQGYVETVQDEKDKRIKHLHTTEKAAMIMPVIYDSRASFRNMLGEEEDVDSFDVLLDSISQRVRETEFEEREEDGYHSLKIGGLQKFTLLDYPGKAAAVVFLSGCNMKCPYCHNKDLVYIPENFTYLDPDEVLAYLDKRKNLLDGVCISGGEALLQEGLVPFLKKIRKMGYQIKLDTNGMYPERLENLLKKKLVDMVAMDIKNSKEKYGETCGMNPAGMELEPVERSIALLKNSKIDYLFRTTVVKEFHTKEDIEKIAQWLAPCKEYDLQQFMDSGNLIQQGWHGYEAEEMKELQEAAQKYIPNTKLKGVKAD